MCFALLALFLLTTPALAEPISPDRIRVIDGDTIRVDGKRPDIRLMGFNAPETRRAKCSDERIYGGMATKRLREMVQAGNLDLTIVRCASTDRTIASGTCNYGRKYDKLKHHDIDVKDWLIWANLAVPFKYGKTRYPKMPKPWC